MIFEVQQVFDGYLREKFAAKPDILRFLLQHERKPLCMENLCTQIRIAELSNIGKRFNQRRYHFVICEIAKLFASAALEQVEQKLLSHAEVQRRIDEANIYETAQQCISELEKEARDTRLVSRPGSVAN